ncbi:hypothetical protein RchiOBHm_Chr3g0449871 [Rosa chinensis]|uniref:Ubiquitin-like domain-containing protein n=1 Tax=Rosa chinensis TaxID=74649 RepID=A0A2P6R5N1_ROSCH|nr:uncharacterized protein LOC112194742 [Rosa chinensis]PRQ41722.1 hypothetical protein RchiOBHm_Chr3g0449871 [Rosa chinensis]
MLILFLCFCYSENFLNEDWDLIDFEKLAEGGDLPIEEPVDGAIDITLDFGDMCPFTSAGAEFKGTGTNFKFYGNHEATIKMYTSDTLRKLREEILRHFDEHLGIELRFGEEVILKLDGDTVSFRDCDISRTQDINVILRSPPPIYDLGDLTSVGEIDVIIHAKGFPRFIVPVFLLDSVQDIKEKIMMITFIDQENQMLYYRKKVLEEDSILAYCGLYNNCRIQLVNTGKPREPCKPSASEPESSTPASEPESTPASEPESTPASEPESTPASVPESTPISVPESTPGATIRNEIIPGATIRNEIIRVCLYYGDFNLPLPSATFEVKADSCLNVLKAEILKQVESYLVLKLPSAEEVRVGGSSQCDISLAQCQLFGMANIKVLLKQPPPEWLGPYCGGVLSTRSMMTLKELVILRNGTDRWPAVRFKLRMHPQRMVLHIKEVIEKISNAKKRYQRLLNYATEEELFDYSQISQICTMIELRISVQGLSEAAKLCH